MPLPTLITPDDTELYGYSADIPVALLDRVSARVRAYSGQQITEGTSEVTLWPPYRLPQRPVREITSVTWDDDTVDADDYTLKPGGYIDIDVNGDSITVEYEHGYTDELPSVLVEFMCSIAARMNATDDHMSAGVVSESAGGESITWGAEAYRGVTSLTREEKATLDRILSLKAPRVVETL